MLFQKYQLAISWFIPRKCHFIQSPILQSFQVHRAHHGESDTTVGPAQTNSHENAAQLGTADTSKVCMSHRLLLRLCCHGSRIDLDVAAVIIIILLSCLLFNSELKGV